MLKTFGILFWIFNLVLVLPNLSVAQDEASSPLSFLDAFSGWIKGSIGPSTDESAKIKKLLTIEWPAELKDVKTNLQTYQNFHESCAKRYTASTRVCVIELSPQIQTFAKVAPTLLTAASSMAEQCSSISKYADYGQIAVTGFNAACAAAKALCSSSCNSSQKSLDTIKTLLENNSNVISAKCVENREPGPGMPPPPSSEWYLFCKSFPPLAGQPPGEAGIAPTISQVSSWIGVELQESAAGSGTSSAAAASTGGGQGPATSASGQSTAYRVKTCNDYGLQLASSLPALINFFQMAKGKADKCKENEKDGSTAAQEDQQSVAGLQCNGRDANTPECICINNPRSGGCSNGLAAINATAMGANRIGATAGKAGTANGLGKDGALLGGLGAGAGGDAFGGAAAGGAKSGGGAGAGSPGGGGSGGGSGGGDYGKSAEAPTKGDPLAMSEGGGGGGGGGGGKGFGANANKFGSLSAYRPGGAKDPNRQVAGWSLPKDISGSGGKSNWEKVRDRYNDNRPSLLGQ